MLNDLQESQYFSLSFDASSKGNCKMIPYIVNYFSHRRGIQHAILEVYEQPNETAEQIASTILEVLKRNCLDLENLTSLGADNTNTNYGCNHSVFTLVQQQQSGLTKGINEEIG